MAWTKSNRYEDSPGGDQPQAPGLPRCKVLVQEFAILNRRYTVMVGNINGAWQCHVTRNDRTIFGPTECGSEAEAKLAGHVFAFTDAGLEDHYCNGDCSPWQPC